MHDVEVATRSSSQLLSLLAPGQAAALQGGAALARGALAGRTVWNVSSTATGGGVAEMLPSLIGTARGAGVDVRWVVLDAAGAFFTITKRIHNRLHGVAGDDGALGAGERQAYEQALAGEGAALAARVRPGDVVILHDPQTAGLVTAAAEAGGLAVWRCHVGLDTTNDHTDDAWRFLRPYIEQVRATVFSRARYRPAWAPLEGAFVIAPAIDPLSVKNAAMDDATGQRLLVAAGLLAGDVEPDVSGATLLGGQEITVRRRAQVVRSAGPLDPATPLVVQVSRWDHLKDMPGVMRAFAEHVVDARAGSGGGGVLADVHLWLVGPAVEGVLDDPEGITVHAECEREWRSLPAQARERVSLVTLPMQDVAENAAMVNAIQRHAAVVVQKSLVEGFGLTVAEAMWKARPVVASAVGGILDQITDDVSGRLVPPHDLEAFGAALRQLLVDPDLAAELGRTAREVVQEHFLPDRQLRQWADLLISLRVPSHATAVSSIG